MMRVEAFEIKKPMLLTGSFWQPSFYPHTENVGFYSLRIEISIGHFSVSVCDAIKIKVFRETAKWLKREA